MREGSSERRALALILGCGVLCAVVRRAFATDDAYITFRTVDNLIHGYGARWNVAERVQTYTSPLWMLVVSVPALFTRDVYVTSFVLEFLLTATTLYLITMRVARDATRVMLCVLLMALSKAYVDYSTSGLENSLAHALVALFGAMYVRRETALPSVQRLTLVASLVLLTRADLLLLIGLPLWTTLTRSARENGRRATARAVAKGATPLFAWYAFALFYYGSLIPSSGRAKLTTGIPLGDMMERGMYYCGNSLREDPVTLPFIVMAFVLCLLNENRWLLPLAVGAIADCAYILWIGGDHMGGRFFSSAFVMAIVIFARLESLESRSLQAVTAATCVFVAWMGGFSSIRLAEPEYDEAQVADAAFDWAHETGLNWRSPNHPGISNDGVGIGHELRERNDPTHVEIWGAIGIAGYFAGPKGQILDKWSLTDPLLSRLPIPDAPHEGYWRSGHWERPLPRGYVESFAHDDNEIENPSMHAFYDALRLVTRGPLFSPRRWGTVLLLNLGYYDHYLREYLEEYEAKPTTLAELPPLRPQNSNEDADCSSKPKGGYTWHQPCATAGVRFSNRGVLVRLPRVEHSPTLDLELSAGDYAVAYWRNSTVGSRMPLTMAGRANVTVPAEAVEAGYDAVSIGFTPDEKRVLSFFRLQRR